MYLNQLIKIIGQACPPSLPAISLAGQPDIRQAGLGQAYKCLKCLKLLVLDNLLLIEECILGTYNLRYL